MNTNELLSSVHQPKAGAVAKNREFVIRNEKK